jgi:hypothetical protein
MWQAWTGMLSFDPYLSLSIALCAERVIFEETGGEGGIRTPDTVARMPHFECGAIDHSATSPSQADEGASPRVEPII